MSIVRRDYVDVSCGQLHYRSAGDGDPVVLLHQNPNSSAMYDCAYPLLAAAGFRAIGIDHPGVGMSDPPAERPQIADYARLILEALDALGLERPHLVGHHTGAAIACELAIMAPDRVAGLVLSGAPVLDPADRDQVEIWAKPRAIDADGSHLTRAWQQRLAATPGWTDLQAMNRGVLWSLMAGDRFNWGFMAGMAYPMAERLPFVKSPILFLTNTGEDMYQPTLRGHEISPRSELIVFEGGTRDIVDERPEAFVDAVAAFLRVQPAR